MTQYVVVTNGDTSSLESEVMGLMLDGWECQGGISVSHVEYDHFNSREGYTETDGSTIFAQAMIKRE